MNWLFTQTQVGPYPVSHRVVMAPLTRMAAVRAATPIIPSTAPRGDLNPKRARSTAPQQDRLCRGRFASKATNTANTPNLSAMFWRDRLLAEDTPQR
jgi:hypothetical protein